MICWMNLHGTENKTLYIDVMLGERDLNGSMKICTISIRAEKIKVGINATIIGVKLSSKYQKQNHQRRITMTIDEALQILEHEVAFDVRWCNEKRCGTALEMVCNELKITLDELAWYREQDLIRREEVPLMRLYMAINTNHFDDAEKILNSIPKAEYRGDE